MASNWFTGVCLWAWQMVRVRERVEFEACQWEILSSWCSADKAGNSIGWPAHSDPAPGWGVGGDQELSTVP